MNWKIWIKIIAGYALLATGAVAGLYHISLHPNTMALLNNPFTDLNLLIIALPFICVFGLISGVWVVWKATEG